VEYRRFSLIGTQDTLLWELFYDRTSEITGNGWNSGILSAGPAAVECESKGWSTWETMYVTRLKLRHVDWLPKGILLNCDVSMATTRVTKELFTFSVIFLRTVKTFLIKHLYRQGERGWRSGNSNRLPQMWVEFVVGSRPCSQRFRFPKVPVPFFSYLLKNQHFQITIRSRIRGQKIYLFICLFIYFNVYVFYSPEQVFKCIWNACPRHVITKLFIVTLYIPIKCTSNAVWQPFQLYWKVVWVSSKTT